MRLRLRRSPFAIEFAIALVIALIALIATAGPGSLVIVIVVVLLGLALSFLPRLIRAYLLRRRLRPARLRRHSARTRPPARP